MVWRHVGDEQAAILPAPPPNSHFGLHRSPAIQRCTPIGNKPGLVIGMNNSFPIPSRRVLRRQTRKLLPALIDEIDLAVRQGAPGMCRNRIDDIAKLSFTPPEILIEVLKLLGGIVEGVPQGSQLIIPA